MPVTSIDVNRMQRTNWITEMTSTTRKLQMKHAVIPQKTPDKVMVAWCFPIGNCKLIQIG